MKKPFLISFIFFLFVTSATAQKISSAEIKMLRKKEDSLKMIVKSVMIDSFTAGRMRSDSQFIKTLVRSLQIKNSFYYPFDSIKAIGNLYAPDSTFRIITWQLSYDDYYCRQRGAIQLRTTDGSLKLIPLRDYSEFASNPLDSVRSKDTWIGAVYYNIIKTQHKAKNFYTLFGFDNNSVQSNKKWIEVMTFNEKNLPVFGGQFFSYEKDSVKRPTQYRFAIEYKKDASTTVNFDPELNMILIDHLVSESDEPDLAYTFVPDGDYEGFKWVNGKWIHVNKVFTETVDMKGADMYLGKPPIGDPLLDQNGKHDEKKLEEKSNKNKSKGKKEMAVNN